MVPSAGGAALDAHQQAIRARIVASGRFYLVMTTLRTGVHLRTAIMNPLTEIQDLEALIAEVISVGRSII